jgi:probable F420-dependent oxidoreductase
MHIGLQLPNKGPRASRALIGDCARIADALPVDDLWVFDHVAVPPDNARGSDGFYVEPLATLAFVAGITERIGIGTRVLILPYRNPYLIAKWAASLQALSDGRLRLGCGVGWMEAEFQVLGVDRTKRGALTDRALETIHRCFAADEVEINGATVLFLPRPARPPIFIGGAPPHALHRVVRYGEGWMPGSGSAVDLAAPIAELRRLCAEAGKAAPEVIVSGELPLADPAASRDRLAALGEIGATRFVLTAPYETAAEFRRLAEGLVAAAGRG